MNRREFVVGSLVGGVIGFTAGKFGFNENGRGGLETAESSFPRLKYYPVTHFNELFILFTHIGQSVAPELRALEEYRRVEMDVFRAVMDLRFFDIGNDFVSRLRTQLNDSALLTSPDRNISSGLIEACIRDYPYAWSPVIHRMFVHSPEALLKYVKQVAV